MYRPEEALSLIEKDVQTKLLESEGLFRTWYASALDAVRDIRQGRNLSKWDETLTELLESSHGHMASASASQLWLCRSIYTDTSILKALVQVGLGDTLKAIGSLDHAIIIAGAPGNHRLEIVHGLISSFQSQFCTAGALDFSAERPAESNRDDTIIPLPFSSRNAIQRISAPSFLGFQSTLSKQPFIVSGYAQHWPALNEHPWRRASYLRSVSGPGRLVPVEVGKHYLLESWKQVILGWDKFLSFLKFEDQERTCGEREEIFYLAQHNLFLQFPALREDVIVPDYAYANLISEGHPYYAPPSNDDQLVINSWLGPEGTISPPHTDPYNNLYVQVVGQKTVWLSPPTEEVSTVMLNTDSSTLRNTSRWDVFAEDVDAIVSSKVAPQAMSATLNAGDLLYFPVGWWHAMRSDSTSHSVSFWF